MQMRSFEGRWLVLDELLRNFDGSRITSDELLKWIRGLGSEGALHPQRLPTILQWAAAILHRTRHPRLRLVAVQNALQCASAARLRSERQSKGLSLRAAAALVGLHFGSYTHLETGRTHPRGEALLHQLAVVYELPTDWLEQLANAVTDQVVALEPQLDRGEVGELAQTIVASWISEIDRRWGPTQPGTVAVANPDDPTNGGTGEKAKS